MQISVSIASASEVPAAKAMLDHIAAFENRAAAPPAAAPPAAAPPAAAPPAAAPEYNRAEHQARVVATARSLGERMTQVVPALLQQCGQTQLSGLTDEQLAWVEQQVQAAIAQG